MITTSQLNAITALVPSQLSGYLTSHGWIEDGDLGEIATIWHRKENEYQDFEILQPLTIHLKDYYQRVYDLIEVISNFEQRAFFDVVNDLNNFQANIIKIQVIHEDVEGGSIPLNDGVLLFEKAKELLISVVRSTYSKRKHFSGGNLSEDITEIIESMRLGQTEHGSYVVNLIAPLIHKEKDQQELSKSTVSRLVSETLTRSLSAIDESIKEYTRTKLYSSFDKAVDQGVSANLCDALIGISGKTKSRDVKITIFMSKVEDEFDSARLEHKFASNLMPYLQIASDYYKEKHVLLNQVVSGLVTKLSHEEEENVGTVTIDATVNGLEKSVSIELPIDEYWKSHSAHKKSHIIKCLGDLHVTSRSAKLINVKDFRVISNDDLFDE